MSLPDTSTWTLVGRTTNTKFYVVEPGILCGLVEPGARDDATTARENIDFYHAHFRDQGPGQLFYFLEHIADQTADARRIYRDDSNPELLLCVSLIVNSLLSRAVASFFLGIARPKEIPLNVAASLDEARAWARGVCARRS